MSQAVRSWVSGSVVTAVAVALSACPAAPPPPDRALPLDVPFAELFDEYYPMAIGNEWVFFHGLDSETRNDRFIREVVTEDGTTNPEIRIFHLERQTYSLMLPPGALPTPADYAQAAFTDTFHLYYVVRFDDQYLVFGTRGAELTASDLAKISSHSGPAGDLDYDTRPLTDRTVYSNDGIRETEPRGEIRRWYVMNSIYNLDFLYDIDKMGCSGVDDSQPPLDIPAVASVVDNVLADGLVVGLFEQGRTCDYDLREIYARGFGPIQRRGRVIVEATVNGEYFDLWPDSQ